MLAETRSPPDHMTICFYEQVVINLAFPEFPDAYQFAGMIHGTIITDGHSVQTGTSQMEKGQSLGGVFNPKLPYDQCDTPSLPGHRCKYLPGKLTWAPSSRFPFSSSLFPSLPPLFLSLFFSFLIFKIVFV